MSISPIVPTTHRSSEGLFQAPSLSLAYRQRVVAALGVFVAAWPFYVFGSSQAAYLVSAAAICFAAWELASRRDAALAALVLAEIAVIGTEANGSLAAGSAPLGSLRLLDLTLLAAVVGTMRTTDVRNVRVAARRPWSLPALLSAGLVGYALVLWAAHGGTNDDIVHTDVRLIGLVVASWIVLRGLRPPAAHQVGIALAAITFATVAKALALYVAGYWTIGTRDRVQAASVDAADHLRVILVGGDSLLIVAPACLVALSLAIHERRTRSLLVAASIAALGGLLLSGTRTGLLVSLGLLAIVAAHALLHHRLRALPPLALAALGMTVVAFGVAAVASGTVQRFASSDDPAVGLNFRSDELKSFWHLPARDLVLGQGIGGRFSGKSSLGLPVEAGWSHTFPASLILKTGIVGLPIWLLLLVLGVRAGSREMRERPTREGRALVACGALALVGTLAMSATLGRAALPEGALLIVLGWLMITWQQPGTASGP